MRYLLCFMASHAVDRQGSAAWRLRPAVSQVRMHLIILGKRQRSQTAYGE